MLANEGAEAEPLVEGVHQPLHSLHAFDELVTPLAELGGGEVFLGESFSDRVGGKLAGLEREKHARRVNRIEEAEGAPHERPAVTGHAGLAVGEILGAIKSGGPAADGESSLHRRAALHLFIENRLMIAAAFEEVIERGDDADADHVVVLRNVPEPPLL